MQHRKLRGGRATPIRKRPSSTAVSLAVASLALMLGSSANGQNTIGGDVFAPGEADFVQSGSQVGRGPVFQFSDEFYLANGIDPQVIRDEENGALAPNRFGAFYRGVGDNGTGDGEAPDDRFVAPRMTIHNMGFDAAGEPLYYPDPPAFLFESAFLDEETKDLTNRSRVFLFPRTVDAPSTIPGCEAAPFINDRLAPGACNRRQDNIFDTGNGYLTSQPARAVAHHVRDLGWPGRRHAAVSGRDGGARGAQWAGHRGHPHPKEHPRGPECRRT